MNHNGYRAKANKNWQYGYYVFDKEAVKKGMVHS